MSADTIDELEEMARKLGMQPRWVQDGHYDLHPPKRALAVNLGALEITTREMVAVRKRCRVSQQALPDSPLWGWD